MLYIVLITGRCEYDIRIKMTRGVNQGVSRGHFNSGQVITHYIKQNVAQCNLCTLSRTKLYLQFFSLQLIDARVVNFAKFRHKTSQHDTTQPNVLIFNKNNNDYLYSTYGVGI